MAGKVSTKERISGRIFSAVHGRNLVYNTCWEDPALDRVALDFQPDDRVMVITSAGCNALDYLLAGAGEVNAVDMNPIQNALLELKKVGIRRLDYAAFWELFGKGKTPNAEAIYRDALREHLSPFARRYWDKNAVRFFGGKGLRKSFYYRGTSGLMAKLVMTNVQALHRLKGPIEDLLEAGSVDQQREIYESRVRRKIWTPWLKWFLSRSAALSLLGVPWPQRQQLNTQYPGGVSKFIRDSLEAVLTKLPFKTNYFWRVYLQGHYTPEACPEYLKPDNFARLKAGAVDGLHTHTSSVADFLWRTEPGVSKFVLLDHMDWLSLRLKDALSDEWSAILRSARPGAKVIFRSAGLKVDFLDDLAVKHKGRDVMLGGLLNYRPELAATLHERDRVHTYGSFYIADLPGA